MTLLWHLIKFNFIFHKMRIAIISIVCFFILLIAHFFNTDLTKVGDDILSYSTSLIGFIIVGKMSLRNNAMFDIKHLLGLPLSKAQIVLHKSIADLVHFFPVSFVWIYGLSLSYPDYHTAIIFIIFHLLLVMLNMIALNKRIDFARIQHSSASFKNSFLFLNKYLNVYLQIGFFAIIFFLILAISKSILWREYAFFVFVLFLLMGAYFSTLKILKDESLSYFVARRDIKRMGWKVMVVSFPIMLFITFKNGIDLKNEKTNLGDASYIQRFSHEMQRYTQNMSKKADLMKLANADSSELENYLKENKTLPWNTEVMGGKLSHIAAGKGNLEVLQTVLKMKPEEVNSIGTIKNRTPIFTALNSCQLKVADYLLEQGANINHQDIDGNTPILFAAKSGCFGGVLLLKERGADLTIINNEKEKINDLVKESGLAHYWDLTEARIIASEKKD